MHPRLQKGACSTLGGLPHSGQVLDFSGSSHSRRTWEAWGRPATRSRRRPAAPGPRASRDGFAGQRTTAGWATRVFAPAGSNAARRSRARASNPARSWASSNKRGMTPRADDLHEAEAVHRGAFERFGQRSVDRIAERLARSTCRRPWAGRSRSIRQCRADGSCAAAPRAGHRELGRRRGAIDVDQASSPESAKRAARRRGKLRRRSAPPRASRTSPRRAGGRLAEKGSEALAPG